MVGVNEPAGHEQFDQTVTFDYGQESRMYKNNYENHVTKEVRMDGTWD